MLFLCVGIAVLLASTAWAQSAETTTNAAAPTNATVTAPDAPTDAVATEPVTTATAVQHEAAATVIDKEIKHVRLWQHTISGSLSNRYRLRATDDDSDQDLETIFSLEYGEPLDKISATLQVGGIFDLDGVDQQSQFTSIYDSFDSTAVERIYYGYVTARDVGVIREFRVGRQFRYEFEPLYFDGALVETVEKSGVSLSLYGGVPVHLFESRLGSDAGDWLLGGALSISPCNFLQGRIDIVHLVDTTTGFRADFGDTSDTLYGASLWFDPLAQLHFTGQLTAFTDQLRDASLQTYYYNEAQQLTLQLRYYTLIEELGVRTLDVDAFGFLGTYDPYYETYLTLTKTFMPHFSVDLGGAYRSLYDEEFASAFNHTYWKLFLAGSTYDFPMPGMNISLSGDYYNSEEGQRNNAIGSSLSIRQELLEKRLNLAAGTAYYLYRYNLFAGDESNDVRSYYANAQWQLRKDLMARLQYEFETSDLGDFHTLDSRLVWSF